MEPTEQPVDRVVVLEDRGRCFDMLRGKARNGEQGRPFREWVAGTELHRDTGEPVQVERVIDREHDRYFERITDAAGNLVRPLVDEPLSEHRGHGAAKRRPPTDPAA